MVKINDLDPVCTPSGRTQRGALIRGSGDGFAKPNRLRGILANGLLLVASIVAGAVFCEVAVRLVAPQQLIVPRPELYRPDDVLGWAHRGDVRTTINTGEGPVQFRTDSRGYRIPWNGTSNPSNPQLRILMLGDSFLEATAVDASQTVPELLRAKLAAGGRPVSLDNTGVGGWDPNQYLIQAKRSLSREKYDLGIVLLYIGNDLVDERIDRYPPRQPSQLHAFQMPRSLRWKEWINAVLYPTNDLLKTRSHLYLFLKTRMEVPLSRLGLTEYYFPEVFALRDASAPHWDTTAGLCDAIRSEFAAHGAKTVFVLVPTPYQVDPVMFERYVQAFRIRRETVDLDQPNKLLTTRLRAAGLITVDPLASMRVQTAGGAQLFGAVDRHLNAAGHKAISELLLPVVKAVVSQ